MLSDEALTAIEGLAEGAIPYPSWDAHILGLISEIRSLRKVYEAAKYWEENSHEYPEQTGFWVSDQKKFLKGQSDTKDAIAAYESGGNNAE